MKVEVSREEELKKAFEDGRRYNNNLNMIDAYAKMMHSLILQILNRDKPPEEVLEQKRHYEEGVRTYYNDVCSLRKRYNLKEDTLKCMESFEKNRKRLEDCLSEVETDALK